MTSTTIREMEIWLLEFEPSTSHYRKVLLTRAIAELKNLKSEIELLMLIREEYDAEIKMLNKELGNIAPLDDL